nr:Tn3 family transposase [Novosphingobium sp. CECT 9465]
MPGHAPAPTYRSRPDRISRPRVTQPNTLHLGHAVEARRREGLDTPDHLLAHISPLGWAHILLTGEYLWPKDAGA